MPLPQGQVSYIGFVRIDDVADDIFLAEVIAANCFAAQRDAGRMHGFIVAADQGVPVEQWLSLMAQAIGAGGGEPGVLMIG